MAKPNKEYDNKGRRKVQCKVCGRFYHRVDLHVRNQHGKTTSEYKELYPGAELYSEYALESAHKKRNKTSSPTEKISVLVKDDKDNNEEVVDENVFKIGVARLQLRKDVREEDELLIPKHDPNWIIQENEMIDIEDMAVGIEDSENVYIGGPTGAGKTAMVLELASYINQPVKRIQLKRDFKVSNFVGRATLEIDEDGNQVTSFKEGPLPQAMKNGWWLLCDEIDQAHPDVLMELQAILEGTDLVLTEDFGRVVERHPNFRIIATANTFGHGDDSGLYAGAKVMNEATMDRFGVTLKKEYPSKKTEIKILQTRTNLKKDILKKMVECAHKVREAFLEEECNCTFSTRRLILWAKKTVRYNDPRRAAKVSVLNKLDEEDSRFVDALLQRYFGGDV